MCVWIVCMDCVCGLCVCVCMCVGSVCVCVHVRGECVCVCACVWRVWGWICVLCETSVQGGYIYGSIASFTIETGGQKDHVMQSAGSMVM